MMCASDQGVLNAQMNAALAAAAPHVLMRPRLFVDGNQYCALYGDDLVDGCAGFGDTPAAAMDAFDRAWATAKPPRT
jgi:hypothetical protein